MTQKENVFNTGPDVASDALEPEKVGARKGSATVKKEEAAGGFAHLVERNGNEGFQLQHLLGGQRETRDRFQGAPVATVPAKPVAFADQAVPAEGGVKVVEKKTVGAREGQVFGDEPLAFAGPELPDEDALEIGIAVDEHGGVSGEGLGQ